MGPRDFPIPWIWEVCRCVSTPFFSLEPQSRILSSSFKISISGLPWDTLKLNLSKTETAVSRLQRLPCNISFPRAAKGTFCHNYPSQDWKPATVISVLFPLTSPYPESLCWSELQISFPFSFSHLSHHFLVLQEPISGPPCGLGHSVLPEGWHLQCQPIAAMSQFGSTLAGISEKSERQIFL